MSAVELYGLKRCSTCVKALKWLDARGIACRFTDYREQPVAPDQLEGWSDQLGGFEKLVNRSSTTWRNLPEEQKAPASAAQWLALVAQFPALIRRPVIVLADGTVSTGFSEKKYEELFV